MTNETIDVWIDEECASCGSQIKNKNRQRILEPQPGSLHKTPMPICTLCYGSNTGTAFMYPKAYTGIGVQLQTIAQVGNMILDSIEHTEDCK